MSLENAGILQCSMTTVEYRGILSFCFVQKSRYSVIRFFHIVKYFKIAHFISRLQNLCFHIFHNDKAAQNHCTLHVIRKFIYVLLMVLFALKLKNK
jgi:hypothetical protein